MFAHPGGGGGRILKSLQTGTGPPVSASLSPPAVGEATRADEVGDEVGDASLTAVTVVVLLSRPPGLMGCGRPSSSGVALPKPKHRILHASCSNCKRACFLHFARLF